MMNAIEPGGNLAISAIHVGRRFWLEVGLRGLDRARDWRRIVAGSVLDHVDADVFSLAALVLEGCQMSMPSNDHRHGDRLTICLLARQPSNTWPPIVSARRSPADFGISVRTSVSLP
jgi:hypothetical protein